ncbi:MAG TPA: MBL fold metallo-hydrolase [Lentisphaeria bacterium]|nr:MAG: hypothetical protein A2X47_01360 [Lentisphaerae bacterium GWF2_38_69]HBM17543.1 MBL fold metallo-hydrolase [Lentisphaeria bacterium]
MKDYSIEKLVLGPFETNCYILSIDNKIFIIDPGSEAQTIISTLEKNAFIPFYILLTHAHIDHISAVMELAHKYNIEVYLNENDELLYKSPANSLEPFFPRLTKRATTNSCFIFDPPITAIHTPGHTQGGTSFYVKKAKILISGDTIFNESIGRTDLPGGNHKQLLTSIKDKILTLPPDTVIYPGHGTETSVDHELKFNPYF